MFEEELDPKNLALRATKAEEIINTTIQKLEKDMFSQKEKAMNDLQREAFITKVLAELTVDLTVCKLMSDEPLKEWKIYLEKFKKEIDNLYERVSNK